MLKTSPYLVRQSRRFREIRRRQWRPCFRPPMIQTAGLHGDRIDSSKTRTDTRPSEPAAASRQVGPLPESSSAERVSTPRETRKARTAGSDAASAPWSLPGGPERRRTQRTSRRTHTGTSRRSRSVSYPRFLLGRDRYRGSPPPTSVGWGSSCATRAGEGAYRG